MHDTSTGPNLGEELDMEYSENELQAISELQSEASELLPDPRYTIAFDPATRQTTYSTDYPSGVSAPVSDDYGYVSIPRVAPVTFDEAQERWQYHRQQSRRGQRDDSMQRLSDLYTDMNLNQNILQRAQGDLMSTTTTTTASNVGQEAGVSSRMSYANLTRSWGEPPELSIAFAIRPEWEWFPHGGSQPDWPPIRQHITGRIRISDGQIHVPMRNTIDGDTNTYQYNTTALLQNPAAVFQQMTTEVNIRFAYDCFVVLHRQFADTPIADERFKDVKTRVDLNKAWEKTELEINAAWEKAKKECQDAGESFDPDEYGLGMACIIRFLEEFEWSRGKQANAVLVRYIEDTCASSATDRTTWNLINIFYNDALEMIKTRQEANMKIFGPREPHEIIGGAPPPPPVENIDLDALVKATEAEFHYQKNDISTAFTKSQEELNMVTMKYVEALKFNAMMKKMYDMVMGTDKVDKKKMQDQMRSIARLGLFNFKKVEGRKIHFTTINDVIMRHTLSEGERDDFQSIAPDTIVNGAFALNMGKLNIAIDIGNFDVYVTRMDSFPQIPYKGYISPYQPAAGKLCLGNEVARRNKYLSQADYGGMLRLVYELLTTYHPENPHRRIEWFMYREQLKIMVDKLKVVLAIPPDGQMVWTDEKKALFSTYWVFKENYADVEYDFARNKWVDRRTVKKLTDYTDLIRCGWINPNAPAVAQATTEYDIRWDPEVERYQIFRTETGVVHYESAEMYLIHREFNNNYGTCSEDLQVERDFDDEYEPDENEDVDPDPF